MSTVDPHVSLDEVGRAEDGAFEGYDLKGMKVADGVSGLPTGIYIIRQGAKVSKLAI